MWLLIWAVILSSLLESSQMGICNEVYEAFKISPIAPN